MKLCIVYEDIDLGDIALRSLGRGFSQVLGVIDVVHDIRKNPNREFRQITLIYPQLRVGFIQLTLTSPVNC